MVADEKATRSGPPDADAWLAEHGDALYRFARLRIGDPAAAEDAVQETLLAALQAYGSFSHRSSERTWLIGILKRKIIDHIRKAGRRPVLADFEASAEFVSEHFNQRGLWADRPQNWGRNPAQASEKREFWDVFTRCLSLLPPRLRHAFAVREIDGRGTDEICKLLEVSATNLWTLLHRARTRLRACLEMNWFGPTHDA